MSTSKPLMSLKTMLTSTLVLTMGTVSAEWYFEAGPWHRGDMRISVDGGSRAAETGARAAQPGVRGGTATVNLPGPGDDGTAQILREFDDGFVGPSGLPLYFDLGQTQFFGFQRDDQHDGDAGTLTFSRSQSGQAQARRTRTTLDAQGGSWRDAGDLDGTGLQGTLGYVLDRNNGRELSARFQLGWLGGLDQNLRNQSAFRQEVRQTTRESSAESAESTRFVFDTFGNPAFPMAPYEMTSPDGIGPLISDTPIAIQPGTASETFSDRVVGRSQSVAASQVHLKTEADLFVFGLGPRIRWNVSEEVSLFVEGGGTLNLLDAKLRRDERFVTDSGRVVGQWSDRADEQKWLWGASLSLGAQWQLNEQLHLSASGGYDWVETTKVTVGPDRVTYDLSGYQVEVALGWRFGGDRP
ncbi:MAG: hypothetical protein JJU29_15305 [Verrucomicrobia bacterium]|nr:hypothetical protein [Verrucomicrobiota bacterium]MCH8514067.1 hypothetical protein [Kiritimatiellia bacterium]